MLIDHDAIVLECLETGTIKFPRKQTFAWTVESCGINDDDIVLLDDVTDVSQCVLGVNGYFFIVKTTG